MVLTLWQRAWRHAAAKPVVLVLGLGPLAWWCWGAATNQLGANPAEYLIRASGDWALRFLCLVLWLTPLRVMSATPSLARLRRMLGLYVYAYAILHLLAYAWFDMGLEMADILRDIGKRPFILVGFLAWLLLTPLAATSFNAAIRWLGGRRWTRLHRLVYAIPVFACLHFFWMRAGKRNFAEVAVYAAILAGALAWRLYQAWRGRQARKGTAARAA